MGIKLQNNVLVRPALMVAVLVQSVQVVPVSAEIFKCTSQAGKVFYNDKPCPSIDDEKKIRSEKDVVNGYVPPAVKKDKNLLKKGSKQPSGVKLNSASPVKSKKVSKSENNPKSQHSAGSSGNRREKVAEQAGVEPRESAKIPSKGNYANRKKTIEDKRIYLGIRKQVE